MTLKRVKANGVDFAYLEQGEGPLVLLVHGFPDTAHGWDEVRPVLAAAGYRAVSPFTRGYWPTEVPVDKRYDNDTLGNDLLALVDALGERQAIIIGHDWGASAAYSAAALGPEKVRLLVTVAIPHPGSISPSFRLVWGGRHFMRFNAPGAEAMVRRDDFAHLHELARRWSPAWNPPPDELAKVKEAFRQPGCLEAALGYYRAIGFRRPRSLLDPIRVPSVAFSGADDGVLGRDDYERARRMYEDRYEIVHMPGGHFMHREHPKRFIEELLRVMPMAR